MRRYTVCLNDTREAPFAANRAKEYQAENREAAAVSAMRAEKRAPTVDGELWALVADEKAPRHDTGVPICLHALCFKRA